MAITIPALAIFFAIIVAVLQISRKKEQRASFSHYAVGERNFKSWFVTMAYMNSWWPGAVFTAYMAPAVIGGVTAFFLVVYSILGVLGMYFIARPVWRWGKKFDLRTQSDLLGLRYNHRGVKVTASLIGLVALFPWLVLGLQSMGGIMDWASLGHLSSGNAILLGVLVIAIRQIWTVQMGMRGLIITDMVQGMVAYVGGSLLIVGLLIFYFHGTGGMHSLPDANFSLPGFDSPAGGLYYFSLVSAGIIGSLCWPMIFTRIYAGKNVREVKKGVLQTMTIGLIFSGLLMLIGMVMGPVKEFAAAPLDAWYLVSQAAGGHLLLAAALVIIFAATMGFVDGAIQAMGTNIANDVVGVARTLTDKQEIVVAKVSMVILVVAGVFVAHQTYHWANLIFLGLLSYQAIIQLAVPLFGGIFWRRGSKVGAFAGLVVGAVFAVVLTIPHFTTGGAIAGLEGLGSGMLALAANAVVYIVCSLLFPNTADEQSRIDTLFAEGRSITPVTEVAPHPGTGGDDLVIDPVLAME